MLRQLVGVKNYIHQSLARLEIFNQSLLSQLLIISFNSNCKRRHLCWIQSKWNGGKIEQNSHEINTHAETRTQSSNKTNANSKSHNTQASKMAPNRMRTKVRGVKPKHKPNTRNHDNQKLPTQNQCVLIGVVAKQRSGRRVVP